LDEKIRQAGSASERRLNAAQVNPTALKVETMNNLTRWENKWNPFKEMDDMQKHLVSLFHRWPLGREGERQENMTVAEWAPLVDVIEDEKEYLIKAELPEVKKEDLKVTVEKGVLTVTGERKFEKEEKDKRYHRIERAYGSFARSFIVPDDADPAQVNAEFKDGVLRVRLAKSAKALPKSIEVNVG
jgi:HSP20 family protein